MLKRAVAVVVCCVAVGARAQDLVRMQDTIAQAVATQHFSGSVLVVKDKTILVDQGYGAADLEWKVPNSPSTKFRLGSLTKQFTAASILLLQEQGKLNVDGPVSKYMPDAPAAWAKVTIAEVLNHTAGIPSFTEFADYQATERRDTTPAELVARFKDKPLEFEPGSKFKYSNSGYVLLGYLLEKVSGQPYETFVRTNLFAPLGMTATGLDHNVAILPERAQGYTMSAHGVEHAGYISMTVPFSAGALYSTTGDLLKWEQGLFGGKVLKAESLKRMTTPVKDGYGFGVGVGTMDGHKVVNHSGGIEGFVTMLSYFPDDGLTVVVLANNDAAHPGELANNLGRLALGMPVVLASERKEVAVPVTTLQEYAGVYRLAPTFTLTMTVAGGKLMTQATGQSMLELHPESTTKFFLKEVNAQVEFHRDAAGKVSSLTLFQGGAHEAKKE